MEWDDGRLCVYLYVYLWPEGVSTNFNDRRNLLTAMLLALPGFWGGGGMRLGHIDKEHSGSSVDIQKRRGDRKGGFGALFCFSQKAGDRASPGFVFGC